jgi:hypothetical protein
MWALVKKGTLSPILSQSDNMTSVEIDLQNLIEDLCDAFPGSVSVDDFEVIHMKDEDAHRVASRAAETVEATSIEYDLRAIFDEKTSSIIVQCGGWVRVFDDPTEAADAYFEYLVEGQEDKDVAKYWTDFEEIDVDDVGKFMISADNLKDLNTIKLESKIVSEFISRLRKNKENENKYFYGDGYRAVVKDNPWLWRWYDCEESANSDPGVIDGSRKVEKC